MKNVAKKIVIVGVFFILMTTSLASIQAMGNKKNSSPQTIVASNENVLANMTVTWDSFLHSFSINDLQPKIAINQTETTDFYFPEINGTIQMNFTVVCKHRLENPVIIPRFTRVYLAISYNDTYLFLHESLNRRCKTMYWEYLNFTVDPNNQLAFLNTTGENATLTVEVGAYGFPFGFKGITLFLNPITVHPIVTPPKT